MPCSGLGGEGEEAAQWEEKPQKPWRGFEKPSDFICLAPCMKSRHSNRCLQHKHEAIGCSALHIPCSALLSIASASCCCIIAAWKHQQATFSPDPAATSPPCPCTFAKQQQLKQQKSCPGSASAAVTLFFSPRSGEVSLLNS